MKQKPSPSVETLLWSITWTQAFPTLLASPYFGIENDPVWHLLAFDAIFDENRLSESEWKHKRDEASMENSLGYGEITIPAVIQILQRIELEEDSIVMDLGSGNGRVILAACLAHPFSKAIGVEIVDELHKEALQNLHEWNRFDFGDQATIELQCGDFTNNADLIVTANLIFVHATVFSDSLMDRLQHLCEGCAPGTYFVMVTMPLSESGGIETLETLWLDMNWGEATVYIQRMMAKK